MSNLPIFIVIFIRILRQSSNLIKMCLNGLYLLTNYAILKKTVRRLLAAFLAAYRKDERGEDALANVKTALVTGASRGIGRETARQLLLNGWQVAVNYCHSQQAAVDFAQEMSGFEGRLMLIQADVSDRREVDAMADAVLRRFGQVDLLVNNAGIAQQKLFTDLTFEEWRQIFAVDVDGVFHCCQALLPQMIRRQEGKIVNISSIWGMTGASCEVAYSAAKAAVIGITKSLAKELGPSHIQVNCVAPGVIATQMNGNLDAGTLDALREETPLGVIGSPADIARTVLFLASEGGDLLTGQVISPNGGFVI